MDVEITANDGYALAARLFPAERPIGAVLVVGAMGVSQRFYEPLAERLAERGFTTMTFDFRGIGASRRGSLADLDADIVRDWAERDTAAALDALAERAGGLPITWLGHSLGGQIVPFVPNRAIADKIVTVATGSGYWRENAAPTRRKVWLFWFGAVPLATPLFGYFPGRKLGMVGDLPRGVIEQWRRWCLDRDYAVGAEPRASTLFADVKTPITSLSFTDDEMMSEKNVASIHGFYTSAPKDMRRFEPHDLGVKRVGHFGFFRREMAPLWDDHLVDELARAS
ncbi:MAG: alpha/beta fold hydrolase [Labilithrix sp.]|nr:alpha/beta fold hydrolase [Labilithrix sp.]MCW5814553.1 alpha/beta fold hydrolase [Labilithrix sp.]